MKHRKLLIIGGVTFGTLLVVGVVLFFWPDKAISPVVTDGNTGKPTPIEPEPAPEPERPELISVQPEIDAWAAGRTGRYSIVVYDLENEQIVGQANKNEVYFAASIYKLYVAYEGYLSVQRGERKLNDVFLNGFTLEECLDKMIRESDSPCAEKLMYQFGQAELTETLKTYGIDNTSMTGITTTAEDAATMLTRIWNERELKDEYRQLLLKSMSVQVYRDALATSFSEHTFYDKVGFRDFDEYHDVGILSLDNGRNYVVSMLTSNVGTRNMRTLGDSLLTKLLAPVDQTE